MSDGVVLFHPGLGDDLIRSNGFNPPSYEGLTLTSKEIDCGVYQYTYRGEKPASCPVCGEDNMDESYTEVEIYQGAPENGRPVSIELILPLFICYSKRCSRRAIRDYFRAPHGCKVIGGNYTIELARYLTGELAQEI